MAANETAPEAGSEEYNNQMIAVTEGAATSDDIPAAVEQATKPEAVPDKFWDADNGVVDYAAWGKSTSELEAKFTESNQEAADDVTDEVTIPEDAPITQESFDRYTQEFQETQELSEDSYAELAKAGIPKAYVDAYVEGQRALVEATESNLLSGAGFTDRDSFDAASKWAAANMAPNAIAKFNADTSSGDNAVVSAALAELAKAFSAAKGTTASTLLTGEQAPAAFSGFKSNHEMTTAMSDPRYAKDPAYRAQVMQKLAQSQF